MGASLCMEHQVSTGVCIRTRIPVGLLVRTQILHHNPRVTFSNRHWRNCCTDVSLNRFISVFHGYPFGLGFRCA